MNRMQGRAVRAGAGGASCRRCGRGLMPENGADPSPRSHTPSPFGPGKSPGSSGLDPGSGGGSSGSWGVLCAGRKPPGIREHRGLRSTSGVLKPFKRRPKDQDGE